MISISNIDLHLKRYKYRKSCEKGFSGTGLSHDGWQKPGKKEKEPGTKLKEVKKRRQVSKEVFKEVRPEKPEVKPSKKVGSSIGYVKKVRHFPVAGTKRYRQQV